MKIKLSVLLFTALFSAQLLAQALPSAPFVVVRGHAEREMRPDRYEINITVQKTSMDLNEASQTVETKTAGMVQSLKALGLKPEQITASNISVNPDYRYDNTTQRNVFIGNTVTRNLSAKFSDRKALQKFIAEVPAGEEIRVGGISTSLSTQDTVESELLDLAVADAKKQAATLLGKFGQKIIGIHTISQNMPSIGVEPMAMYKARADMAAAPPLGGTMEDGVVMVSKDVYVVYLIAAQ